MKLKTKLALIFFVTTLGFMQLLSRQAYAVCNYEESSKTTYEAMVPLDIGNYEVYVRPNSTANEIASLSIQNIETDACEDIGEIVAESAKWNKLGTITTDTGGAYLLSLQYVEGNNTPAVLIVPNSLSPCADVNNCLVIFRGKQYNLQPSKISMNSDSLLAAKYQLIDDKTEIKKALFYIDNSLAYTSVTNVTFDTRYVGSGDHNLKTNIILNDGQVLELNEKVDYPFDFIHFIYPTVLKNSGLIRFILISIGVYAAYIFIISLIRRILRKRKWKKQHVAQASTGVIGSETYADKYELYKKQESSKRDLKLGLLIGVIPILLLGSFVLVDKFVLSTFKVDGVSMETTLHDTTTQWLYKLPVTAATLNKGVMPLSRGEVVVLHHDDNNLFDQSAESEKTYVVKRVLGFSGERITVKDGQLLVYPIGSKEPIDPDSGMSWQSVTQPSYGRYIDITLKAGELFVVGDNRIDSIDSRNYGPVKIDEVVGRVLYKVNPQNKPYNEDIYP